MLHLLLALAQAAAPLPDIAFDLRAVPPRDPGEITVTARRDPPRARLVDPAPPPAPPQPWSLDLGPAKAALDARQGRLGDGQVGVTLTVPF